MIRLRETAEQIQTQVESFTVKTEDDLHRGGDLLQRIKGFKDAWNALFDPMVTSAKEAEAAAKRSRKTVEGQRDIVLNAVVRIETPLRTQIAEGHARFENERRRQAEVREAEAIAKAKEEKEREVAHHRNLAEISGDKHYARIADQIEQAPIRTIVVAEPPPLKIEGTTVRDEISVEWDDPDKEKAFRKLVVAVYLKKVPMDAIMWNEKWLTKKAEQDGDAFSVPGVRRKVTKDLTVRRVK